MHYTVARRGAVGTNISSAFGVLTAVAVFNYALAGSTAGRASIRHQSNQIFPDYCFSTALAAAAGAKRRGIYRFFESRRARQPNFCRESIHHPGECRRFRFVWFIVRMPGVRVYNNLDASGQAGEQASERAPRFCCFLCGVVPTAWADPQRDPRPAPAMRFYTRVGRGVTIRLWKSYPRHPSTRARAARNKKRRNKKKRKKKRRYQPENFCGYRYHRRVTRDDYACARSCDPMWISTHIYALLRFTTENEAFENFWHQIWHFKNPDECSEFDRVFTYLIKKKIF